MPQFHKCSKCKRNDIKLYRPYGEFLRDSTIKCRKHVPKDNWDWYVPMIEDTDGSVWGYTSVPPEAIDRWERLPEPWSN
jgi:hypothetical protein